MDNLINLFYHNNIYKQINLNFFMIDVAKKVLYFPPKSNENPNSLGYFKFPDFKQGNKLYDVLVYWI
jgi:hypothetical protein